jgi:hypothetical protein
MDCLSLLQEHYIWSQRRCRASGVCRAQIYWNAYNYSVRCCEDCLCSPVVRVSGYRSRGPGSTSGATKFSEKYESRTESTQPHEYNWEAPWKKSTGSGLESREYGRRDPLCWPHDILYQKKLTLTSPTSGGRSVSIIRSRTEATYLFIYLFIYFKFCSSHIGGYDEFYLLGYSAV